MGEAARGASMDGGSGSDAIARRHRACPPEDHRWARPGQAERETIMNCRSGSRAGAREHRACREDEEAGRASGIECRVPIDAFGVIDVAREFGASMGMPKAGSVHYANAWLPTRASGAGSATRVAGAVWRRPPRTSSTASCPKCRCDSGCCRCRSRFDIGWPTIERWPRHGCPSLRTEPYQTESAV